MACRGRVALATHLCPDEESTRELATAYGKNYASYPSVWAFYGDLGAGKTTWIQSFAAAAAGVLAQEVTSPTFATLHTYTTNRLSFYHFDLYRLQGHEEFTAQGLDEHLFEADSLCCIEWAERIEPLLTFSHVSVALTHSECGGREVALSLYLEAPWG